MLHAQPLVEHQHGLLYTNIVNVISTIILRCVSFCFNKDRMSIFVLRTVKHRGTDRMLRACFRVATVVLSSIVPLTMVNTFIAENSRQT